MGSNGKGSREHVRRNDLAGLRSNAVWLGVGDDVMKEVAQQR